MFAYSTSSTCVRTCISAYVCVIMWMWVCVWVCVLYVPTITCTPPPPPTHAPTPLVSSGLLGAHFAAVALRDKGHHQLAWYTDQLLEKAEEVGQRLLPAFNTTTGLPYPKVCILYILFTICIQGAVLIEHVHVHVL